MPGEITHDDLRKRDHPSAGWLVWASPALPGSAHELSAARTHGIIDALANANVMAFADKGYQGASGSVRTPFQTAPIPAEAVTAAEGGEQGARENPCPWRTSHRHAKDLETPAKLRCCPRRSTAIVQAILVLHRVETDRYAG
ncbi:hypothetical protein Pmi06nite_81390 [Planotetraspora mira]|uniref:DDE Tnp4 domain-containing protein n=1 Tax=Planotetraspora mira TaxID=58121 RepID=A0A8J3TYS0_9ACTN|nr:hypothetical protein Pmi06nite_81390 [Planotetraspora mira]